jgi:hypothetical protein
MVLLFSKVIGVFAWGMAAAMTMAAGTSLTISAGAAGSWFPPTGGQAEREPGAGAVKQVGWATLALAGGVILLAAAIVMWAVRYLRAVACVRFNAIPFSRYGPRRGPRQGYQQSGAVSAAFYVLPGAHQTVGSRFVHPGREQPFTGGFRHLGQRLCEGGELIAQPTGLLDIIEADNADILRNIQAKLVASGVNKAAGNKVGDAEYAVGAFSWFNSSRAARTPVW